MPNNEYKRLDDNGLLYLLTLLKSEIESAAGDVNVIETVKVNGTPLVPDANKAVDVSVPTATSDLTNDSGFQNSSQVQAAIDDAIAGISGIEYQVVQELPAEGEKGVIYLLSNSGTAPNIYDEYIWIEERDLPDGYFEKIGTTAVDLSGYVQASEMHAITNAEIDTIFQQVFGS